MNKIAIKLANRFQKIKSSSQVDLLAYKKAKQVVAEASSSIQQVEQLVSEGLHPQHAYYVHSQNVLSSLIEYLLEFKELDRYRQIMTDAEDEYMPGGPPMSPITHSFFFCWALSDLAVGLQKETIATILLALAPQIGLSKGLILSLNHFNDSKMGLYKHLGINESLISLQKLNSNETIECINPTGYQGQRGELWFARILPNLIAEENTYICFTTPYVLTSSIEDWNAFFDRKSWVTNKKHLSYNQFMKYGLSHHYWLEYVMQSYQGISASNTAIFLQGLPDCGETRPHFSPENTTRLPEHRPN